MPAIECMELTQKFGDLTAVDHVSFKVERKEIFGLLGPNGAGKTTLIRMLTTVLSPTEGTAIVAGHDVRKESLQVRERISVVPELGSLDWFLPVYDNFEIYGRIQKIPRKERKEKIEQLLKEFGLDAYKKTKVEQLSGGFYRRVQVARGFMPSCEILFLDEPTLSLDPQSKRKTWDFIKRASKSGQTILLSTHNMEEADYLCDRVGIIDHGKVIAMGTPTTLKETNGVATLEELFIKLTGREIRNV